MTSNDTWSVFRWLVKELPGMRFLVWSVFLTVVLSAIDVLTAQQLSRMLDAASASDWPTITAALRILLTLGFVLIVSRFARSQLAGVYAERGTAHLRVRLAEQLSRLPIDRLQARHSGDYSSLLTNDLTQTQRFTSHTLVETFYRPLTAVLAFGYLCTINWRLTLASVAVVPILLTGMSRYSKRISGLSRDLQQRRAAVNAITQDVLSGVEVMLAFGLKDRLAKRYGDAVDASTHGVQRIARQQAMMFLFRFFFSVTPILVILVLGGYWVLQGQMTAGALIAFLSLVNHLTFPLAQWPQLLGRISEELAASERVRVALNMQPERSTGNDYPVSGAELAVCFDHVSFIYPRKEGDSGSEYAIEDLCFSVRKGETVAFVGRSGSGKSTVFRLLLGHYESYTGNIDVFDQPLRNWQLDALRRHIAYVPQESFLFPTSIAENIGYGKPDATQSDIEAAAKLADAYDFVTRLPEGFGTQTGELGNRLSGGQRQRLAIARAVVKDAPLLVLDEATSALDPDSEALVQSALQRSRQGKTSLIIAHRLSTVQSADRILVMDQGRILEEGTHAQLFQAGGMYYRLCLQELVHANQSAREVI